jgi:hypothetical protein
MPVPKPPVYGLRDGTITALLPGDAETGGTDGFTGGWFSSKSGTTCLRKDRQGTGGAGPECHNTRAVDQEQGEDGDELGVRVLRVVQPLVDHRAQRGPVGPKAQASQ